MWNIGLSGTVWVGLGSNLADRLKNLQSAIQALSSFLKVEQVSSLYLTEPVGYRDQPFFLNACLRGRTQLSPFSLLEKMKEIEKNLGREETFPGGPRVIDLDLLFFDQSIIERNDLFLPHPRVQERGFVLLPLIELSPHFLHPRLKKELLELWSDWEGQEALRWLSGPGWEKGESDKTPPLFRFLSLTSTERVLGKLARHGFPPWTAIKAESQIESKWYSPRGGLYFSLLLPTLNQSLERATLACALALERKGVSLKLLWPQYLLLGRLVAGALCLNPSLNLLNVGLNLHLEVFPPQLKARAISLHLFSSSLEAEEIFLELYRTIQDVSSLPSSSIYPLWAARDIALGKMVIYQEKIRGIGQGLTEGGYLLRSGEENLLLKQGRIRIDPPG